MANRQWSVAFMPPVSWWDLMAPTSSQADFTGEAWHTIHVHENTHVADPSAVYLSYVFRDEVV